MADSKRSPYIREAILQERVGNRVRCLTCERRCLLSDGATGWCRTHRNVGGRLVTLIYGSISSLAANPIEKKPLYHFYPGSYCLTMGSWGCNAGCPWCQNWNISKSPPRDRQYCSPEQFVAETIRQDCQGTSISFNEPTLSLDWSLDVFRLARVRGLYNTFVTNGYMTSEALALLIEAGLDAMNVDIKGDAAAVKKHTRGMNVELIWRRCRESLDASVHVEITTLVIPTVNDSETTLREIASRIARELGADAPWHVTAYFPAYHFDAPPTPVHTLERARQIGKEAGLRYVYVGNVPGRRYSDTYCPGCDKTLVQRLGFDVLRCDMRRGKCPSCGQAIAGVGWPEAGD